jgi:hypothetical protein
MALQELQIYGLWAGKQTAKGTALVAPAHRFKQVAGGFNFVREDGSENYSDATQFPSTTDWINTMSGTGQPGIEATPEELAFLLWLAEGGETTSAVTGPPAKTKHTAVPLPGLGHWHGWTDRLGSQVINRWRHNDCQVSQLQVEGSTANKAVRVTPSIVSIDPAEQVASDPVAAMPTKAPFLYSDGTARFTIDGTVFRGHSQFTIVINKDLQPVYSDDTTIYDLAIGNAVITIAVTLFMTSEAQQQYYKLVYGTTTPAAGAKPIKNLPANGSYSFDLRPSTSAGAATGDKFLLTVAGVKWAVPDLPDPNADGGAGEVSLAGAMRKSGSSPAYQTDIDCDAAAFTA